MQELCAENVSFDGGSHGGLCGCLGVWGLGPSAFFDRHGPGVEHDPNLRENVV